MLQSDFITIICYVGIRSQLKCNNDAKQPLAYLLSVWSIDRTAKNNAILALN